MAHTNENYFAHGGLYEWTREYLVERTALFGIIRWDEVVRVEKINDDLILAIWTSKMPTKVTVNGKDYELIPLSAITKE